MPLIIVPLYKKKILNKVCGSILFVNIPLYASNRNLQNTFKKVRSNKEKTDCDRALEYFDNVYPKIHGTRWNIIRKSLLQEPKYIALINNFAENYMVIEDLKNMGAFDVGEFYTKKVMQFNIDKNVEEISLVDSCINKKEFPVNMRPSKLKLTDDEKAALVDSKSNIDHYPERYRQMALASGIFTGIESESKPNSSRKLDALTVDGVNFASAFDYVPPVNLKGLEDWMEEDDPFIDTKESDHEIGIRKLRPKDALKWPEYLKAYSFVAGDTVSEFKSPHECQVHGIFPHYLMNGASLLPVLALDLQPQDKVLDMCASPGGKSLAILQSCLPNSLVCNDVTSGRIERIMNVLDEYIPEQIAMRKIVEVTKFNGCIVYYEDYFDKVLVDVPCLNDRHSVQDSVQNIFKTSRVKERMKMPEVQAQLLLNAIKAVKPGGSVVYSTCTLSPLQNDGSVHLALTRVWKETQMECTVVDLGETMRHLGFLCNMGKRSNMRHGDVIIPTPDQNFGPMYFCKIIRTK